MKKIGSKKKTVKTQPTKTIQVSILTEAEAANLSMPLQMSGIN
jgi:hypothetical protein